MSIIDRNNDLTETLSNQTVIDFGDVPEWPKGAVCKTVKPAVQIRPSPPIKNKKATLAVAFLFLIGEMVGVLEAPLRFGSGPWKGRRQRATIGGEPEGSRPGGLDKSARLLQK